MILLCLCVLEGGGAKVEVGCEGSVALGRETWFGWGAWWNHDNPGNAGAAHLGLACSNLFVSLQNDIDLRTPMDDTSAVWTIKAGRIESGPSPRTQYAATVATAEMETGSVVEPEQPWADSSAHCGFCRHSRNSGGRRGTERRVSPVSCQAGVVGRGASLCLHS